MHKKKIERRALLLGMLDFYEGYQISDLPFDEFPTATAWLLGWHFSDKEQRFTRLHGYDFDYYRLPDITWLRKYIPLEIRQQTEIFPTVADWHTVAQIRILQERWAGINQLALQSMHQKLDGDNGKMLEQFKHDWPQQLSYLTMCFNNIRKDQP